MSPQQKQCCNTNDANPIAMERNSQHLLKLLQESGAPCPTRTDHLLITNQLLYQMS